MIFFKRFLGGLLGEKVQLSVMNLNKQSKLYSQGMQPVVRCVGDYGQSSNWERIKEKCSYRVSFIKIFDFRDGYN